MNDRIVPPKIFAKMVFEFVREDEEMSPEGHFDHPDDLEWVHESTRNGNDYAWFCAKVVARIPGFNDLEGTDYLGGCSYESRADFESGDYFEDMKNEAALDLYSKMIQLEKNLKGALK